MQKTYELYTDIAMPGLLSGQGDFQGSSKTNSATDTPQLITVTPAGGGVANSQYQVIATIAGKQTADTTAYLNMTAAHTVAELNQRIAEQINFNQNIFTAGIATVNGALVQIEGRRTNEDTIQAVNWVTTAGTAAAVAITAASQSTPIPFGVFVGYQPGADDWHKIRPMAAGLSVAGVTLSTYHETKDAIGPNALTEYKPTEEVDVVSKTLANEGIWTLAVEADFNSGDTVHASYAAGTVGYATKNAANAEVVTNARAKRRATLRTGQNVVLIELT